jgi:hypothetical protein
MTKLKIILVGVIALAGGTASLVIQHEAQVTLRESDALMRQQDNQLAELSAEHQRLSNRLAQGNSSLSYDQTAELSKLRADAEALRKQTNELGKQLVENRHSGPWQNGSRPHFRMRFLDGVTVVSDSKSEEYQKQLDKMTSGKRADVRHLSSAVHKYAREHENEFPTNLEQAAAYLYEIQAQDKARTEQIQEHLRKLESSGLPNQEVDLRDLPPAETKLLAAPPHKQQESFLIREFEMVYQGSSNELTNVPWQAVALIRERQAWPTPGGKWARIYVMASGEIEIVESADNFQSWEAAHIIPPQTAGQ